MYKSKKQRDAEINAWKAAHSGMGVFITSNESGFGDSIGCEEIGTGAGSGVGEGCSNEEEWV